MCHSVTNDVGITTKIRISGLQVINRTTLLAYPETQFFKKDFVTIQNQLHNYKISNNNLQIPKLEIV